MNDVRHLCAVGLLLAVLCVTPASGASDTANRETFVGYARDRETDAALYKEVHSRITRADGSSRLEVVYVDPHGETIATYSAAYSDDPLVPQVRFEDHRRGTVEGVRREGGAIILFRRRSAADDVEERRATCSERPVADAGLEHLIHSNWARLMEGDRVVAELLIPQRLRCLRFFIEKADEWSLDGEPVVTLEMEFTNPLIRLLAGKLIFTYHRDHRFLVRFEGKSRLVDESGANYEVRVDFPISERADPAARRTGTIGGDGG